MERDKFWDESVPKELPYTIAALPFRKETNMSMTEEENNIPVFTFNGPGLFHGPVEKSARKYSTPSLPSASTSIFSSLKGVMMGGRKHSRTDSLWSTETGIFRHQ